MIDNPFLFLQSLFEEVCVEWKKIICERTRNRKGYASKFGGIPNWYWDDISEAQYSFLHYTNRYLECLQGPIISTFLRWSIFGLSKFLPAYRQASM